MSTQIGIHTASSGTSAKTTAPLCPEGTCVGTEGGTGLQTLRRGGRGPGPGQNPGVRLVGEEGNKIELRISGYQFPAAPDPRKRFSWHMVAGSVSCEEGSWAFEWQALRCDESPLVSRWLRVVSRSGGDDVAGPLRFMEPNLTFEVVDDDSGPTSVAIVFDHEFSPDFTRDGRVPKPFRVVFRGVEPQLIEAADDWDADLQRFPDQLAT